MTDHVDLDALDRLIAAATPGPWAWDEPSNWAGLSARVMVTEPSYGLVATVDIAGWRPRKIGTNNAALIVALSNAAPALLAELRAARAELDALRTRLVEEHEGNTAREEARLWERRAGEKETEAYLAVEDVKRLRARAEKAEFRADKAERALRFYAADLDYGQVARAALA
ncbi:MAG: hypothetical protein ABL998_00825 [Planctomycetota bacterium]